jgi:hypothetical protein
MASIEQSHNLILEPLDGWIPHYRVFEVIETMSFQAIMLSDVCFDCGKRCVLKCMGIYPFES